MGVGFQAAESRTADDIGLDWRMDRVEAEISLLRQVKHLQENGDKKIEAA
jgi:hypothetical protein